MLFSGLHYFGVYLMKKHYVNDKFIMNLILKYHNKNNETNNL